MKKAKALARDSKKLCAIDHNTDWFSLLYVQSDIPVCRLRLTERVSAGDS